MLCQWLCQCGEDVVVRWMVAVGEGNWGSGWGGDVGRVRRGGGEWGGGGGGLEGRGEGEGEKMGLLHQANHSHLYSTILSGKTNRLGIPMGRIKQARTTAACHPASARCSETDRSVVGQGDAPEGLQRAGQGHQRAGQRHQRAYKDTSVQDKDTGVQDKDTRRLSRPRRLEL